MIPRTAQLAALLVASCCAIATGASCSGNGTRDVRPAPGDARNQASNDVNEQLLQLSAHPDLEILIRTGTQHWAAGEITLLLRGNGTVEVTQRQATKTTSFEGELAKDELDACGRTLHSHRFTAARTSALPREPGDVPAILTLRRDGEVVFTADLWNADRFDDADLGAILRAADQLVHRVSAGKLGQP